MLNINDRVAIIFNDEYTEGKISEIDDDCNENIKYLVVWDSQEVSVDFDHVWFDENEFEYALRD